MWHKEHWGRQGETNASYIHLNCACRIIQGNNGSDQMHLWEQENFIYWRLLLPLPSRRSVASKVSELCNTLCNEVRVFNFYNLLPLISKLSPEAPLCRLHWDHRRWQTNKQKNQTKFNIKTSAPLLCQVSHMWRSKWPISWQKMAAQLTFASLKARLETGTVEGWQERNILAP